MTNDDNLFEYVFAAKASELIPGRMITVDGIDRVPVVVTNLQGQYCAFSGVCTHKGGYLWEGELKGEFVTCPLHNAYFRVKDGRHTWPAPRDVRSYPVKIHDGSVFVGKPKSGKEKNATVS